MDAPQTLGKYEIRGTLGRGAMGVVYDGWDPQIARRVAIKTVQVPANPDPDTAEEIARFKREAQAAGRLTHPNIVGVYDYGETGDIAYIVMEFVEGPSLKGLLDKQERFDVPALRRVMDGLLAGLQFSHERGVVHRDIKPANVMLTKEGQPKIADFGIARIEMSSMTQAGTMLGTPAYMSPEQFMGQVVDARTDVYSAGVLLYQLLTGERPFDGGLTAIMHKVLNTEPPPPSTLAVTAPAALDAVVRKAMAKRPDDRYPSAAAFAEAIRGALDAPAGTTAPLDAEATLIGSAPARAADPPAPAARPAPAPPSAAAAVPARSSGSRAPLLAGVAVVALLVLGGGGWFLLRPAAPPAPVETATVRPAPATPQGTPQPTPQADTPAAGPAGTAPTPPTAPTPAAEAAATQQPGAQPSPAGPVATASAAAAPATAPTAPAPAPQEQPAAPLPAQPSPPQVQSTPLAQTAPAQAEPAAPAPAQPPPPAQIQPPPVAQVQPTPLAQTPPAPQQPAPQQPAPAPAQAPTPAADATPAVPIPAQPQPQPPAQTAAPAAPAPQQVAMAGLAPLRQMLAGARCSLADAAVQDSGTLTVSGVVGRTEAAALRTRAAGSDAGAALDWHVQGIDPVFCNALDLLRPVALAPGGLTATLSGGRTALHDGERIRPRITMPDFAGELRVDYLGHDGSVVHLYPTVADPAQKVAAQPARRFAAGERLALGDSGPGKPIWEGGPPYGTDMIIAIASSAPLLRQMPAQNAEDNAGAYLRELAAAIAAARQAGTRLAGTLLLVDTLAK